MGFFGVGAGAFGAHGLKTRVSVEMLAVFETAVRYQMYHALALCLMAWVCARWQGKVLTVAGCAFVAGVALFSGSLYLLVLTNTPRLGLITPFGGVLMLIGWACLAWGALTAERRR
ncbi:MAG: DUF423 domain-containing protein [Burkholderiales bacterium]|nr:DUF423 domain-containing protein [Burkholderiales bacterium]